MTEAGTFRSSLVALIPQLRAYAISLCRNRDQADDIVQETLLKGWSSRDTLHDPTKLKPWLLAILRNEYQLLRRKQLRANDQLAVDEDEAWIQAPQTAAVELGQVGDALNLLPIHEREALVLVGVQELSYEDAATVAGCPVGTMKSRVCTGRRRLGTLVGTSPNSTPTCSSPSQVEHHNGLKPRKRPPTYPPQSSAPPDLIGTDRN